MRNSTETAVVLVLAFFVLPFAAAVTMGAHVPLPLWVLLAAALLAWIPAHRYSSR